MFLSRARWTERLGAVLLMIVALFGTSSILDLSFGTGLASVLFIVLAVQALGIALVVWAVATRGLSAGLRRTTMAAAILIAVGGWACVRVGGVTNDLKPELHWRWAQTPEERLLAQTASERVALPAARHRPGFRQLFGADARLNSARRLETPGIYNAAAPCGGFRGSRRDGIIPARIVTDWTASPPVELWRRLIGPGWSSFAVHSGLIYTQEQRGNDELVSCYNESTGKPVWIHRDQTRFYESGSGPGPRGTPTFNNDRVYALAHRYRERVEGDDGAAQWSATQRPTQAQMPGGLRQATVGDRRHREVQPLAGSSHRSCHGNPRWRAQTAAADGSPQLFTIGPSRASPADERTQRSRSANNEAAGVYVAEGHTHLQPA
jgi:hypothetical protein